MIWGRVQNIDLEHNIDLGERVDGSTDGLRMGGADSNHPNASRNIVLTRSHTKDTLPLPLQIVHEPRGFNLP